MIYYNEKLNKFYYGGRIVMRLDDGSIFHGIPKPEELIRGGYVEYTPSELTPEEALKKAKTIKLNELGEYDSSNAVNSFTLNGQEMWLTVQERQQVATQISANEAIGRETMTRWFEGHEFTFPITVWKQMLTALEVYAGDAFNVTERHKATINALTTKEEVNNYDYTVGYPTKLAFGESENILEP